MKPIAAASAFFLLLLVNACTSSKKGKTVPAEAVSQSVPREFRAAWVATVANINWPSNPGLTTGRQQQEAIELLDFLKDHHYNAVIFQVRPQADALYESSLEPWSYFLTGEQGKAPSPWYDPLAFWIEEAHKRGLELHAWLNPYRSHHVSGGPVTEHSTVKKMPELMVHLKEGYWWFDPSLKETQDHGIKVVMDIVKRYNVDGIHFDDYFYPYASYNKNEDFPDTTSRRRYLESGGNLSTADWRRKSVNDFIERLYHEIKKEKKHVKFGLSPFGIWRPGYPSSIEGLDQYNQLYADARLWLNKGWVDYFSPQLYWPISRIKQSFPVLLRWWSDENTQNRHLWPGINVGRDTAAATVLETLNQIMVTRGMLPQNESGVIHWSLSSVTKNPAMAKMLLETPYAKPALAPASPWLGNKPPTPPSAKFKQDDNGWEISWSDIHEEAVFKHVVYYEYVNLKGYEIFPSGVNTLRLPAVKGGEKLTKVAVTAVDRLSNESKPTRLEVTREEGEINIR